MGAHKSAQHGNESKTTAHSAAEGAFFAPAIQPKLTVNQPGDTYEQEADRVADQVTQRLSQAPANGDVTSGSPSSTVQRAPIPVSTIQAKSAASEEDKLQKKEEEEQPVQEKIQRKPIFDSAAEPPNEGESSAVQRKPEVAPFNFGDKLSVQRRSADNGQEDNLQTKEEEEQPVQEKIQRKPIFDSAAEPPPEEGVQRKQQPGADWATLQLKCAECAQEDAGKVQREESDSSGPTAAPDALSGQLRSSKGGGSPLPEDTRNQMEGAFGADFSSVRIHTGGSAEQMSDSVHAQAFTHGSDIYFNSGKYDTGSTDGKKLLAHELTHTVQQGAAIQRKVDISKGSTPQIQRGALDWIKGKIMQGLNWAAERLIPGYSLLNVILGRNLITDEPVARSGVNIVKAYMRLVPVIGSILLSELEETDTLPKAGAWAEEQVAKFGINFDDIAKRLTAMWDEMSIWRGMDYNVGIFRRYIGPVLGKFLAFSGVMQEKMKELRLEGALRLVGATELLDTLRNAPAAFKRMADNPGMILTNFMNALKQGFSSFKDNFGTHFKNALFGWLLGKAASMGLRMPKQFSIAGIFHLVAQVAGLTYGQIKALVIQKLGPRLGPKAAKVFAAIEKAVEVIRRVVVEGPIALWELVKEQLSNLKEMVISQITQLVTSEIIKSAVTKLLSMLNPAGALVQLVLTLYRVIKFFIDNWDTIKEIALGIIGSITKVAMGQLGEAAGFVERILGKGIQLIISFLARIFGLSGIADKVKVLIKKFGGLIIKARDWLVNWLVQKGKALYEKLFGKKEGKEDKKKGGLEGVEQEIKSEGEEKKKDGEITKDEAQQIAGKVKQDQGALIKSISVRDAGTEWEFDYVQRITFRTSKYNENDKPKYAPDIKKWEKKGGKISVSKTGTWTYTDWEGNSVRYINGYPVFPQKFIRQKVAIEDMQGNHTTDYTKANEKAKKAKLPENTWHHHEDRIHMLEVDGIIHARFTHMGGVSLSK